MVNFKSTGQVTLVSQIRQLGRCLELVPLDPNFHDITVGLYEKDAIMTVWTFSRRPGVKERIKTMEKTNDGFVIAEKDLELRGGGDIHGLRQSGLMNLKIANPVRDADLLESAQQEAFAIAKNNEVQARALIYRWIGTRQDYSDS